MTTDTNDQAEHENEQTSDQSESETPQKLIDYLRQFDDNWQPKWTSTSISLNYGNIKEEKEATSEAFEKMFDLAKQVEEEEIRLRQRRKKRQNIYFTSMVAMVLIFVGVQIFAYLSNPQPLLSKDDTSKDSDTYMLLSDGTMVILAAGSKLTEEFNAQSPERKVSLEGKAYFKVAKMIKPFFIKTGKITSTVLGTSFSVEYDTKTDNYHIAVESGKVRITEGPKRFGDLGPDMTLRVDCKNNTSTILHEETGPSLSWLGRDLKFENKPLGEICETLGKRFQVHFSFASPETGKIRVHGSFEPTLSLNDLCEVMGEATGTRFNIDGDEVKVYRSSR